MSYAHALENGVEVCSVGDFVQKICNMDNSVENLGKNDILVFRGQKTDFWKIEPSVFRDNYLSVEHDLLQQPLIQIPHEFQNNMDFFEIMTKYQHYGMCTRLLDLTTNPLVALYFACEQHGKVLYYGEIEKQEPSGIVYYKRAYPILATDQRVKILSAMAKMNLAQINQLGNILNSLCEQSIISVQDRERWLSDEGYSCFIQDIQANYVIRPIYSNDRLIRQSGMFMLPGFFVREATRIENTIIEKQEKDFRKDFDGFFYVDGEKKTTFLQELDRYNINEATLFPELEHQLSYIRHKSRPII